MPPRPAAAAALAVLVGCAAEPPAPPAAVAADAALAPAAQPLMLPESDAVRPVFVPTALGLAGGARLLEHDGQAVLDIGNGGAPLTLGRLSAPPAVAADGARVALCLERAEGARSALVVVERTDAGWTERTLIKGRHLVDRVAWDSSGTRLAFVWAGPDGGVAGLYVLDLASGAPQRLTNRAAAAPGQPPADWLPLPLAAPPRFDGHLLRWVSEDGPHSLDLQATSGVAP